MEKKNRIPSENRVRRYQELDLAAQLADLKVHFYQQNLLMTALIDLLIEKDLIKIEDLTELAINIDRECTLELERDLRKEPHQMDENRKRNKE